MYQFVIPVPEPPRNLVNGINSVHKRRAGAKRDQGIHVWGSPPQVFKPVFKIMSAGRQNRKQKQKLGERENHRIFHARQKLWQRPSRHMPHGNIKQRNRKNQGNRQSFLHQPHLGQRPVRTGAFLTAALRRSTFCASRVHKSAISDIRHFCDNPLCIQLAFIIGYRHTVF